MEHINTNDQRKARNALVFLVIMLLLTAIVGGLRIYQNSIQEKLFMQYTAPSMPTDEVAIISKKENQEGIIVPSGSKASEEDLLFTLNNTALANDERLLGETKLRIIYRLNHSPKQKEYVIGEKINVPSNIPKVWFL